VNAVAWDWLEGGLFAWDADVEDEEWDRVPVRCSAGAVACGAGSFRPP
jgi:hypothetical protein